MGGVFAGFAVVGAVRRLWIWDEVVGGGLLCCRVWSIGSRFHCGSC